MNDRWVTFDCYGTLVDWDTGLGDAMSAVWPSTSRVRLLHHYHSLEPLIQEDRTLSYRQVLIRALSAIAAVEGLSIDPAENNALVESLPCWPLFPETSPTLKALRDDGWRIGILSNTDPDLLASSVRQMGMAPDIAITAAEAGSYKPAHGHWNRFYETTGANPARHVHVAASLFHDIVPASELSIPSVWINRRNEHSDLPRMAELPDLSALPDVLETLVAADNA